jgi:hypothetical protein
MHASSDRVHGRPPQGRARRCALATCGALLLLVGACGTRTQDRATSDTGGAGGTGGIPQSGGTEAAGGARSAVGGSVTPGVGGASGGSATGGASLGGGGSPSGGAPGGDAGGSPLGGGGGAPTLGDGGAPSGDTGGAPAPGGQGNAGDDAGDPNHGGDASGGGSGGASGGGGGAPLGGSSGAAGGGAGTAGTESGGDGAGGAPTGGAPTGGASACAEPGTPRSGGTQLCENGSDSLGNGYDYFFWWNGGTSACMTVFGDAATFHSEWTDVGDFLGLVGLKYPGTQTPDELGNFSADFAFTGSGTGVVYLGIYGRTTDPMAEFYIIEDWVNEPSGSPPAAGPSLGTITVDGGEYEVYGAVLSGEGSLFLQYFSVRTVGRQCGHTSISDHFSQWAARDLQLGKLERVSLFTEGMSRGSGDYEFTRATVSVE